MVAAVLLRGYGFANIEHGVPTTPHTVMQSGSVGKTFTATLVMMLVERGELRLNDSIRTHLTELPGEWQALTVANCCRIRRALPTMTVRT